MQIDIKYNRPVHKPKKHDKQCLHNIIISKPSITYFKKKLWKDYIELPLSHDKEAIGFKGFSS